MFLNCRSVRNKFIELQCLIDSFSQLPCLLLTETWLSAADSDVCFPNCHRYSVFRCDRSEGRGGGVAILIPKIYPAFSPLDSFAGPDFEAVWVQIVLDKVSVRLGAVYRPPHMTEAMPAKLIDYLTSILEVPVPTVLFGDFNYPDIDFVRGVAPATNGQRAFLHFSLSAGLDQLVRFPTRLDKILDLVFVTEPNLVQCLELGPKIEICDHETIMGSLVIQSPETQQVSFRDFLHADYVSIEQSLLFVRWEELFNGVSDPTVAWNIFLTVLEPLINRFVPTRSRFWSVSHRPRVDRLCRRTYLLHKRYIKTKKMSDYSKYLQASRLAQRAKRAARYEAENRILESGDLSRFWNFVRTRLTVKSSAPLLLDSHGKIVVSAKERANLFNQYFVSVFVQDNGNQPVWLFPQIFETISFIDFPPELVYVYLTNLPSKTSAGPDGIPPLFLKRLSLVLAEPLSHIYKISFASSQLPFDWLGAHIVPIYKKKGNPSSCSFYRPVSLTSSAGKNQEKMIRDPLANHMKPFWHSGQHGFLRGRSTVTQMLECLNDWTKAVDSGHFVDILYIDIAKAFDSVSHIKLIAKLQRYGVQGLLLDWIKAFLNRRRQRVKVDGELSDWLPVGSGVPQGSVLGPLLFLVYINDLPLVVNSAKVKIFADDLKIYIAFLRNDTTLPLQIDIQSVVEWTDEYQLRIAFEKSLVLHLGFCNPRTQYFAGQTEIQSVNSIRDLGVIIQHDLKFHEHCAKVVRSSSIMANLIFRTFYNRNPNFLLKMFKTFVRPRLEYATQVWSPGYKMDIDLVESVQRKFTKRISGFYNIPYCDRLAQLKLDPLEYRRLVFDIVMVYKILYGLVDIDCTQFFTLSKGITRGNSLKLFKSHVRHDVSKFFFANRVVDIWNSLPDAVVLQPSQKLFCAALSSVDLTRFLKGRGLDV